MLTFRYLINIVVIIIKPQLINQKSFNNLYIHTPYLKGLLPIIIAKFDCYTSARPRSEILTSEQHSVFSKFSAKVAWVDNLPIPVKPKSLLRPIIETNLQFSNNKKKRGKRSMNGECLQVELVRGK